MLVAQPVTCSEQGRVLSKAVVKAASAMGLNQKELSEILGLSPTSVSRLAKGAFCLDPKQKSWQLALLLVRLFRGLDAIVAGDENSLRAWLRSPNDDLSAIPLERLASIEGLVGTAEYVDAFRARI